MKFSMRNIAFGLVACAAMMFTGCNSVSLAGKTFESEQDGSKLTFKFVDKEHIECSSEITYANQKAVFTGTYTTEKIGGMDTFATHFDGFSLVSDGVDYTEEVLSQYGDEDRTYFYESQNMTYIVSKDKNGIMFIPLQTYITMSEVKGNKKASETTNVAPATVEGPEMEAPEANEE